MALGSGRPTWVPDVTTSRVCDDTPARAVMLDAGSRAVVSLPLAVTGSTVGVISVHREETNTWSRRLHQRLVELADLAARVLGPELVAGKRPSRSPCARLFLARWLAAVGEWRAVVGPLAKVLLLQPWHLGPDRVACSPVVARHHLAGRGPACVLTGGFLVTVGRSPLGARRRGKKGEPVPLDPDLAKLLEVLPVFDPHLSPDEMRRDRAARRLPKSGDQRVYAEDLVIPGPAGPRRARHYVAPEGNIDGALLVYFHGGGFVLGDLDSHDGICRDLASGAGVAVLAVDYRLAPEHPFPAGIDDAWTALAWAHDHARELGAHPGRLAVGGDSAGGNFAAVVSLMARDAGIALRLQLLAYPVTDESEQRLAIRAANDPGIFLTASAMDWFERHYQPDRQDWRASPLLAEDLAGVAPALVLTCEYDPLRPEGDEYAARLRAAGVPVSHRCIAGLCHGVLGMGALVPAAQVLMDESCAALRAALGA